MRMRIRVAVWAIASAIGAALLCLPDDGDRLVGFSDAHGLTLLDAVAVSILVLGWVPAALCLWERRDELLQSAGRSTRNGALFVAGVGSGLVIASAFADFASWWAIGAGLLTSIQLAALLALGRS